jgi:hypothetical protein
MLKTQDSTVTVDIRKDTLPWLMTFLGLELETRTDELLRRKNGEAAHVDNARITTIGMAALGHLIHQLTLASVAADFNPFADVDDV